MDHPLQLDEADKEVRRAPTVPDRQGFPPTVTNWFDRIFVGVCLFARLELFWMRFLEQAHP